MSDVVRKSVNDKAIKAYLKANEGNKDTLKRYEEYSKYLQNPKALAFLNQLSNHEASSGKLNQKQIPYCSLDRSMDKAACIAAHGDDAWRESTAQGLFQFTEGTRLSTLSSSGFDAHSTNSQYGALEQTLATLALIDQKGGLEDLYKGDYGKLSEKLGSTWEVISPVGTEVGEGVTTDTKRDTFFNSVEGELNQVYGIKTTVTEQEKEAEVMNYLMENGSLEEINNYKKYLTSVKVIMPEMDKMYNELRDFTQGQSNDAWRKEKNENGNSVAALELKLKRAERDPAYLTAEEKLEIQKELSNMYYDRTKEYTVHADKYADKLEQYMENEDVLDIMGDDALKYFDVVTEIRNNNNKLINAYDAQKQHFYETKVTDPISPTYATYQGGGAATSSVYDVVTGETKPDGSGSTVSEDANLGYFSPDPAPFDFNFIQTTFENDYKLVNERLDEIKVDAGGLYYELETGAGDKIKYEQDKQYASYMQRVSGADGKYDTKDNWVKKEDLQKLVQEELKASAADEANNPALKNMDDEQYAAFMQSINKRRDETGTSKIFANFGEGTLDSALQFAGMYKAYKDATAPLPHQMKSPEWKDYMYELRQRANRGISPETQTMYTREMDRTYSYDVQNVARYSRSSQAALAALGQAGTRRNDAALKMAAMNEQAKMTNFQAYGQGMAQDEAMTQAYWERNHYNEASRKRDLKAALIGQMTKNVREDRLYAKQYGEGSYYAKYMNAMAEDKKESAINTRAAQLKDAYGMSGGQAYEASKAMYENENPEPQKPVHQINDVLDRGKTVLGHIGSSVASDINNGTSSLVDKIQKMKQDRTQGIDASEVKTQEVNQRKYNRIMGE